MKRVFKHFIIHNEQVIPKLKKIIDNDNIFFKLN